MLSRIYIPFSRSLYTSVLYADKGKQGSKTRKFADVLYASVPVGVASDVITIVMAEVQYEKV